VPTAYGPAIAAGEVMNSVGVPVSTFGSAAFTFGPSNTTCPGFTAVACRSASVMSNQYLPVVLSRIWRL